MTITKSCPECPGKLVERTNSKTGARFLGCDQYPKQKDQMTGLMHGCDHTEPIPESMVLREAGYATLPGFD
jgi:ssDNA-binding Zn-finger/Zn-ribbon topoisomerase 1